jgi:hypothetical protein
MQSLAPRLRQPQLCVYRRTEYVPLILCIVRRSATTAMINVPLKSGRRCRRRYELAACTSFCQRGSTWISVAREYGTAIARRERTAWRFFCCEKSRKPIESREKASPTRRGTERNKLLSFSRADINSVGLAPRAEGLGKERAAIAV